MNKENKFIERIVQFIIGMVYGLVGELFSQKSKQLIAESMN